MELHAFVHSEDVNLLNSVITDKWLIYFKMTWK